MKRLLVPLIFALWLGVSSAFGALHYIRPGATGSGTDWTNALPDIPATLVRGDTYYIAAGSLPAHTFASLAGTTYVYIKRATVADHGTATGWNAAYDGQVTWTSAVATWTISMDYLSVEGVTGSGTGPYGFSITTTGTTDGLDAVVSRGGTQNYLIMSHCEIGAPYPNGALACRAFEDSSWIYHGVVSVGQLIQFCYIHGGVVGLEFCGNGNTGANMGTIVDHCVIRDCGGQQHSEAFQLANIFNVTIRYCDIGDLIDPATTYIEPQQNGGPEPVGIYVYGNIFRSTIAAEGCENAAVLSMTSGEVCDTVMIINNTIYGLHASLSGLKDTGVGVASSGNPSTNVTVENNVWQSCTYGPSFAGVSVQDHDLLNTGAASFKNPAQGDFHLTADTTAGVSFSAPYNVDPDGNTRGANGSTWDLGAYQFKAATPPAGPTLSTVSQ